MKRLLLAFFLIGAIVRADAADYTDIWYNPAQPGYGFNLVQSDDGKGLPSLFVTFFIYGSNGAPTWYSATLKWNDIDRFTGNINATTGSFFGAPWNPASLTVTQVGTATFRPSLDNNYQGTLAYTVTGVGSATTALTRQTLTRIETAGAYVGGQSGSYSACSTASSNSEYLDNYELTVTNNADGSVTYSFLYPGLTCNLTGKYVQNGQYFNVPNALYVCSDGTNVIAQMSEIKRTAVGLEGRFTATGGFDNCTEKAAFGGPKQ